MSSDDGLYKKVASLEKEINNLEDLLAKGKAVQKETNTLTINIDQAEIEIKENKEAIEELKIQKSRQEKRLDEAKSSLKDIEKQLDAKKEEVKPFKKNYVILTKS